MAAKFCFRAMLGLSASVNKKDTVCGCPCNAWASRLWLTCTSPLHGKACAVIDGQGDSTSHVEGYGHAGGEGHLLHLHSMQCMRLTKSRGFCFSLAASLLTQSL